MHKAVSVQLRGQLKKGRIKIRWVVWNKASNTCGIPKFHCVQKDCMTTLNSILFLLKKLRLKWILNKRIPFKKVNKSTVWHFGIYLDFPVLLFFLQVTHMTKKKVQSLSAVFYASACERNLLGWWRVPSNDKEKLSYICCTNAMWALKIWLKRSKASWRVISNAVKPFE